MTELWLIFSLGLIFGVLLIIGLVAIGVVLAPREDPPTYRPNVRWLR